MNTYDWLALYDYEDPTGTDIIEVSFKKGARKEFSAIIISIRRKRGIW